MGFWSALKQVLGGRDQAVSPASVVDADHHDRRAAVRRDPASLAWRSDPAKFRPQFEAVPAPVCPYCGSSWADRPTPTRRSKFNCEDCGNVVHADPKQCIFPSIYLDERQGLIARTLHELEKGEATAGRAEDFWWASQQKDWLRGKEVLTTDEAGDALWTLLNYNVTHMEQINPEVGVRLDFYAEQLQTLMTRYQDEEKRLRGAAGGPDKKGERKPAGSGRIPFTCPSCAEAGGLVARPSRRGSRKCKACGKAIIVDPAQYVFPSPFLSERQAMLTDTLYQLDHWVFTKGTRSDFDEVAAACGHQPPFTDSQVAAIVRALIVRNLREVEQRAAAKKADTVAQIGQVAYDRIRGDRRDMFTKHVSELLQHFDEDVQRFGLAPHDAPQP